MGESSEFAKFLLHVVVLWCFLFYLILLCLNPTQPNYTIVDFHIRVNYRGHNGKLSFVLEIENPNQQFGVRCTNTLLKFYYGQHTLSERTIHSFYQKKARTSQILIHHHVNAHAIRTKFLKAISNGTAELEVSLVTRSRYELWGWTIKHHRISLRGHLLIGSDGKLSGKKKIKLHA